MGWQEFTLNPNSTSRAQIGTLSFLLNTLWYAYHGEDQDNLYMALPLQCLIGLPAFPEDPRTQMLEFESPNTMMLVLFGP